MTGADITICVRLRGDELNQGDVIRAVKYHAEGLRLALVLPHASNTATLDTHIKEADEARN